MTGSIDLNGDDPTMVAKLLDFLYRARYDDDRGIGEGDFGDIVDQHIEIGPDSEIGSETPSEAINLIRGPLVTNAKMYILGDKYDIPSLRNVAAQKYKEMVEDRWYHDTFAKSAELVYNSIITESDILKDVIVEAACSKMSRLLIRGEFVSLLRVNGNIATDILLSNRSRVCIQCEGYRYPICNYCQNRL